MPHRVERFSSTIKQNLAEILTRQLNNPRLGPIYVSQVMMTPDLKTAKVFISSLYPTSEEIPDDNKDPMMVELAKAKGFIKRELGKRMYLKYVPELIFLKDSGLVLNIDRNLDTDVDLAIDKDIDSDINRDID